jgi:hypothetical protein
MLPARYVRSRSGLLVPAASAPYDLYGTDSGGRGAIFFAVNWPLQPTITTEGSVTNNTQLTEALNTPGLRASVAAGSYNALTLASDDQEWLCDDAAIFSGLGGNSFSRIKVQGGNVVTSGDIQPYGFTDLMLRNMNIQANSMQFGFGTVMFDRGAMIHCTVYNQRTGFITPGLTAAQVGARGYDLILAANYISGGMDPADYGNEPAIRVQSVSRCIEVDNRTRCGVDIGSGGVLDTKHNFRWHHGCRDVWARRNLIEFGDGIYIEPRTDEEAVLASQIMGAMRLYDFVIHTTRLSAYAFRDVVNSTNYPEPLIVDGNVGFTDVTANDNWIWNGQAGDTIGSNTTAAYTAPPALGSWLAADGLPPGADH